MSLSEPLKDLELLEAVLNDIPLNQGVNSSRSEKISEAKKLVGRSQSSLRSHKTLLDSLTEQFQNLQRTGFIDWAAIDTVLSTAGKTSSVRAPKKSSQREIEDFPQSQKSFPAFQYPERGKPSFDVAVGTILDKFSQDAFSYEWNSIPLGIDTWDEQIANCDIIFVESAWAGNDGEWKYCFTGPSAPRPAIVALTEMASKLGIPTVFWNKEDPPHYSDFLETARLFDIVLTTDEDCVSRYKAELGHDNIGVLPFGAQPKIHNPSRPGTVKRDKEVSFGGMYFRHKYPERRQQLDYLLPAAQQFDLEIFSRQLSGDPNYQFPERYSKNIVGSLPYDQMLTAYHAYKVFLNVNSVVSSSTMCARRIFEITASGGAIVSSHSPAIEKYFGSDLVPMVESEEEAYDAIRTLLQPGGYRDKTVHVAQRAIWENHTFTHRVESILKFANIDKRRERTPSVSLIVPTMRPEFMENIFRTVGSQTYEKIELVVLQHGFSLPSSILRDFGNRYGVKNWNVLTASRDHSLGSILNLLVANASGSVLSKMDDDDFYGPNYVRDLVNALMFSDAEIVGKAAAYIHFESQDKTILSYESWEHRYSDFVRGATLTGKADLFRQFPFENRSTGEDSAFLKTIRAEGAKVYAADRFNFCIRRSSKSDDHTWQVSDKKLFSTGPVVGYGEPDSLIKA